MRDENTNTQADRLTVIASANAVLVAIRLGVSLWSLLQLQYVQEGHLEEPVLRYFDTLLHEIEEQQSNYVIQMIEEDLPF